MTTDYTIRFLGDPTGYRLKTYMSLPELLTKAWVRVFVGNTERVVTVDVSKAYLVEGIDTP